MNACAGPALVLPDASVAGLSQGEWSQRWWEWASAFPHEESPVADRTGARCAAGQEGQVWFLAGAFGSSLVNRRCTVPRGKYLFFPLVNAIVHPARESSLSCADAIRMASDMVGDPILLVTELDDELLEDLNRHRQQSPGCFDPGARVAGNPGLYPAASDGYYVMLRPLAPGRHTLRFGGLLQDVAQAISYELLVE